MPSRSAAETVKFVLSMDSAVSATLREANGAMTKQRKNAKVASVLWLPNSQLVA